MRELVEDMVTSALKNTFNKLSRVSSSLTRLHNLKFCSEKQHTDSRLGSSVLIQHFLHLLFNLS